MLIKGFQFSFKGAKNQEQDAKVNQARLTKGDYFEQLVRPDLAESIPDSRAEMLKLSSVTTPKAKLASLNKLFQILAKTAKSPVASDDQLPWLIAVLSKCKVYNVCSQLDYMTNFTLSNSDLDETEKFHLVSK